MKKNLIVLFFFCCFFTCDDLVEVDDISNEIVTVLAPSDNVTVTSTTVNFAWENVEDANQYKIQIARPSFEAAQEIIIDSILTTNRYSKTLESGDYQWRIKATNIEFETLFTTLNFSVEE